jgi:hypothetical protein
MKFVLSFFARDRNACLRAVHDVGAAFLWVFRELKLFFMKGTFIRYEARRSLHPGTVAKRRHPSNRTPVHRTR